MMMPILEVAALSFLYATLVSLFVTPMCRTFARELGVVDKPDGRRKIHKGAIPLSGGYGIILAFVAPILCLLWLRPATFDRLLDGKSIQFAVLLVGALIALALGGLDDIVDLRPRYKLLLQWVAATIAFFGGIAIQSVSNPFGDPIHLGVWSYPVTVFWFLACMNALNLLDGLDGLATGVGLFATMTMTVVSVLSDQPLGIFLGACLSGALLGFLVFNFNPASVFLGDGGSMLLGFLVAALSLISSTKAGTTVALLVPFVALGLPVFDTALAMARRWSRRLPMAAGDRRHIHHVLISLGLTQRTAVLILYLVCIAFSTCALLLTAGHNIIATVMISCMAVFGFVGVRALGVLSLEDIRRRVTQDIAASRKWGKASVAVEKAMQELENSRCENLDDIWSVVEKSFGDLGVTTVMLYCHDGSRETRKLWHVENGPPDDCSDDGNVCLRARINVGGELVGSIEFRQPMCSSANRDLQPIIFRLRDCFADHLAKHVHERPQVANGGFPAQVEA